MWFAPTEADKVGAKRPLKPSHSTSLWPRGHLAECGPSALTIGMRKARFMAKGDILTYTKTIRGRTRLRAVQGPRTWAAPRPPRKPSDVRSQLNARSSTLSRISMGRLATAIPTEMTHIHPKANSKVGRPPFEGQTVPLVLGSWA